LIETPLHGMKIGLFGAGHLGRALASCLLRGGVDDENIRLCHRGSDSTTRALADVGLSHLSATPEDMLAQSEVLLYAVRPQECAAIAEYAISPDRVFVSFLAGVPLNRIPVPIPENRRVRVMPSTPDTLVRGQAIAAFYPGDNTLGRALIQALGAKAYTLRREAQFHTFTALGPCLPAALTLWESLGRVADTDEILDVADRSVLPDASGIIEWAQSVRPCGLGDSELESYLNQAATAGGVTEAILNAIREGQSLSESLHCGIHRSQQLSQWEAE
jgi:pyrroline-5-carboxylate reductase